MCSPQSTTAGCPRSGWWALRAWRWPQKQRQARCRQRGHARRWALFSLLVDGGEEGGRDCVTLAVGTAKLKLPAAIMVKIMRAEGFGAMGTGEAGGDADAFEVGDQETAVSSFSWLGEHLGFLVIGWGRNGAPKCAAKLPR